MIRQTGYMASAAVFPLLFYGMQGARFNCLIYRRKKKAGEKERAWLLSTSNVFALSKQSCSFIYVKLA